MINSSKIFLTRFIIAFAFLTSGSLAFAETSEDSTLSARDSIIDNETVEEPSSQEAFQPDSIDASAFSLLKAKGIVAGAKIQWSMDHDIFNYILNDGNTANDSLIIRYNTKTGDKYESRGWEYTEPFHLKDAEFELREIQGAQDYVYQIGWSKGVQPIREAAKTDEGIVWSDKDKFETERRWNWMKVLMLLGALGFFIFGMKIMSEGIQKAAGNRMRRVLEAMTSNRVKGIFTGFLTTSVVQSSSATTVMVVSFVNAGLLKLRQAIGVIMGANIGTTVTAWLIAYFGFKADINEYAFFIIALGFPLMFAKKDKLKSWAEVLIGFAILFMGLSALKHSVPDLKSNPEALEFLQGLSGTGIQYVLLAIFIGTLLTVIVQSSSAAMAITLTLCNAGYIPFEMAAGMVLGENIGTTITANLASLIGNVHAKRAARAHFIFNVFGIVWMLFFFNIFIDVIDNYMQGTQEGSPISNPEARPIALSIFHTSFNIINTLLLVWFVALIEKTVIKMVPSRGEADEQFHLDYIGTGIMGTPELSLLEAKKEVAKFGEITTRMSGFLRKLMTEKDQKKKEKLYSKVRKYEEITDRVEIEVAKYLGKLSEGEMTESTSIGVRSMLSITNDLERIGDIFYQMSKTIERKEEKKIYFTPEQREGLLEMFDLVDKAFEEMTKNLNSEYTQIVMDRAVELENRINYKRNELRKQHLKTVEKKKTNLDAGLVFNDVFQSLEKVGDHIINVSEAVAGQV